MVLPFGIRKKSMKVAVFLFAITISQLMSQDSTEVKTPKKALKYSLIPGGGQLYNGKRIKAILILGSELWMIYQFQVNRISFHNWDNTYSKPKEYYRENRNKHAWRALFVYIYNLVDALVDAHLSTYNEFDFENTNEVESLEEDEEQ